jgi:hypothetical protein
MKFNPKSEHLQNSCINCSINTLLLSMGRHKVIDPVTVVAKHLLHCSLLRVPHIFFNIHYLIFKSLLLCQSADLGLGF